MAEMERKPSLKERAFERLGISALRQKSLSGDGHVTTGILLPTSSPDAVHNGQSVRSKPAVTISVIQDFRPISHGTEMPQGPVEKKRRRPKPLGTIEYQVEGTDTLESIAAQFDTTPSELAKLNKLPSRMIFPGQDIYVPDPNHDSGSELSVSPPQFSPPFPSPPTEDKPRMDIPIVKMADRPPTRIPGHVERQISTSSQPEEELPVRKLSEDESRELDKECYERFIKVNVKHITDGQGVVSGVLLVTPNAIMFDPNVSDPLVIENGPELYGMIAPMDTVISAAMYHDIAIMKLKGQDPEDRSSSPRPEVYHSSTCIIDQPEPTRIRCYRGENTDQVDTAHPEHSSTVGSEHSHMGSTCSCDANGAKDSEPANQVDSNITNGHKTDQSDHLITDTDLINSEIETLVNEVVKRAIESENRISGTNSKNLTEQTNICGSLDSRTKTAESDNDQTVQSLVFVDEKCSSSVERESSLRTLQENLKDLDLESSEYTIDSSGTGTLVGSHGSFGDTSLYTSCVSEVSANLTNDLLLKSREASGVGSEILPVVQESAKPESSPPNPPLDNELKDMADESEIHAQIGSSPNLAEHMQIGNIKYFQYSSVDGNGVVMGPDGKPFELLRQPSKSDPIPMPEVGNKEEITDARSSSFGSFTSSPHINAFVNYATGLFRNTADDLKLVKDITEVPQGDSVVDGNSGSHSDTTATKSGSLESSDKHVAVENAVKAGDMPALFQSIDELIPRPATRIEDPPLYLCLRVGKPIHQRVHSTGPIESYSRKKKKPEYWFSIPRDKVDQLYAFFVQWSPDKYGDEDDIDPASRGFVVVGEEDTEAENDEGLDIFDEYFGPSSSVRIHRDWEIVNKEEWRRRSIDMYEPLPLPELIGTSVILSEDHITQISKVLPGRAVGYPWSLVHSTETNGFSLKTLYRNMIGLEGPILLAVEDTAHNVFGALVACPLTVSEHFYGTGESFLYTFSPDFCVYKWSGENNFFIKGNKDSLAIGAGQGVFGLWFDEDLYHGRSNRCETYDNDPLTMSEDFVLKGLEAWAFTV